MLKRTNFVAHHSSFFDFLLLLDSVDNARDTHKNSVSKVENTLFPNIPLLCNIDHYFLPFSHMLNISSNNFSTVIKFAPFQSSFMMRRS